MAETPYPGKDIETTASVNSKLSTEVITIDNFIERARTINSFADYMEVNVSDEDFLKVYNKLPKTHFQSIVRKLGSNIFYLAGGDSKKKLANLFILQIGSQAKVSRKVIGSNVVLPGLPSAKDKHVENIKLPSGKEWHAGGMSLLGDLLAVPFEDSKEIGAKGKGTATITFYDTSNPLQPKLISNLSIKRSQKVGKTGAVALTRLENDHYLCAAWRDKKDSGELQFYLSKSKNLNDGFDYKKDSAITVSLSQMNFPTKKFQPKYQSIQFVQQKDGKLYLAGMDKLGFSPNVNGFTMNVLNVFEVLLQPKTTSKTKPVMEVPDFVYEGSLNLSRTSRQFSFDAAVGLQIDKKNQIYIYSTTLWPKDFKIRMAEFSSALSIFSPTVNKMGDAIIELYEKENFKGRCLRIFGTKYAKIENYKDIKVQGKHFEKKVNSIKFLIPKKSTYELFSRINMAGKLLKLEGTGKLEQYPKLKNQGFKNKIKSSHYSE